ncbi:MAG TPA: hypothetical protein VFG04_09380 [Planctomycetaceae bacterium]|nr:hypothetical protein [Planctomycetaceae bacterium]
MSFPVCAFTNVDPVPSTPSMISFHWWRRRIFEIPWFAWLLNVAVWAPLLAWVSAYLIRASASRVAFVSAILGIVVLNAACYSLLVSIEFSNEWKDFISVFGTLATLVGLAIAIKQIGDATTAAIAARNAALEQANDYHHHYFTFAIASAKKYFTLSRHKIHQARASGPNAALDWMSASEYLALTADVLENAPASCKAEDSGAFQALRDSLRSNVHECQRMSGGGQKHSIAEWNTLDDEFTRLLLKYLAPLPKVQ